MMSKICGFTLTELLVTVLIVGILTVSAAALYTRAVERSRAAAVLPVLRAFHNALDAQILAGIGGEIDFLGMTGGDGGILPVDVKCSTPSEERWCYGRDFSYHVWCTNMGCFTSVARLGSKPDCDEYYLFSRKPFVPEWEDHPVGEWRHFCKFHTAKGRSLCKSLESQGWIIGDESYAC